MNATPKTKRILVLYWHPGPGSLRLAISRHLHVLDWSSAAHQVLYFNAVNGVPNWVRHFRWDVVVFHYPEAPEQNYIKRLVGLPGEDLQIHGGDLFARPIGSDDPFRILRKPLRHLRAMLVPVYDDRVLFEFLLLEGAQAGLSWETILKKRENYRKAFAGFDPREIARFDARKKNALMKGAGIVRNRLKIDAAVANAQAFIKIQREFGSFDRYVWPFVGGRPKVNHWKRIAQVPATSPESDALSKDLKKRGFRFVGSTIIYAHMQAVGMVNDHLLDCFVRTSRSRAAGRKVRTQ